MIVGIFNRGRNIANSILDHMEELWNPALRTVEKDVKLQMDVLEAHGGKMEAVIWVTAES